MSRGDQLGQGYGVVRDVNGDLIVEVFGSNRDAFGHDKVWEAQNYFEQYFDAFDRKPRLVPRTHVESLGIDKHDPLVEKFRYVGPR